MVEGAFQKNGLMYLSFKVIGLTLELPDGHFDRFRFLIAYIAA